ncbi:hypothetical protein ACJX0J_006983, partial [Zea mays]
EMPSGGSKELQFMIMLGHHWLGLICEAGMHHIHVEDTGSFNIMAIIWKTRGKIYNYISITAQQEHNIHTFRRAAHLRTIIQSFYFIFSTFMGVHRDAVAEERLFRNHYGGLGSLEVGISSPGFLHFFLSALYDGLLLHIAIGSGTDRFRELGLCEMGEDEEKLFQRVFDGSFASMGALIVHEVKLNM